MNNFLNRYFYIISFTSFAAIVFTKSFDDDMLHDIGDSHKSVIDLFSVNKK